MKNLIIEVSREPLDASDYITADDMIECPDALAYSTSFETLDDDRRLERLHDIENGSAHALGWTFAAGGVSFEVKPDSAEQWFKERYDRMLKYVAGMSLSDFCNAEKANELRNIITENWTPTLIYYNGMAYSFDSFIRRTKDSAPCKWYVGGVVFYSD